jgi:hypothetical protein
MQPSEISNPIIPCPYMMQQGTAPMMPYYPTTPGMMMPMMPYSQTSPETMMSMPEPEEMQAAASDPPPILSNNPVTSTIVALKELTGYPNYGNPSRNADILYTGNRGTWTFDLPAYLTVPGNLRARLTIRAALDDHYSVNVNRYSARISINGENVFTGQLQLEHGTPAGGMFTNWMPLTFNIRNVRRNNRIIIVNTSTVGPNDFIALDWMEMQLLPR